MVSSRLGESRAMPGFVIAEDGRETQPEDDSVDIPKGTKKRAEDAECLLSWLSWISCSNESILIRGLFLQTSWYVLKEDRAGNSQGVGSLDIESVK